MFVGKGKYRSVVRERDELRAQLDDLGFDAVFEVQRRIVEVEEQLSILVEQRDAARAEATRLREEIVWMEDALLLQEVGIYDYQHPLRDATGYRAELEQLQVRIKELVRSGGAVHSATSWKVNNSEAQGRTLVKELSRILLTAYNADVENVLRTLRPHRLSAALERIDKLRDRVSRSAKIMDIRITDEYHELRLREIRLTADYLQRVQDEKDELRAERERLREERKAQRELEVEHARLEREAEKYRSALAKLLDNGADRTKLEATLARVEEALAGVVAREANIRAGYVYVISNIGAFGERVVKIGMTRRLDPEDLIRELSDASVPFNFDKHALIFTDDAVGLEQRLHEYFEGQRVNRVNRRREFLRATPQEVLEALEFLGERHLTEFHEEPDALEWRQSMSLSQKSASSQLVGVSSTANER